MKKVFIFLTFFWLILFSASCSNKKQDAENTEHDRIISQSRLELNASSPSNYNSQVLIKYNDNCINGVVFNSVDNTNYVYCILEDTNIIFINDFNISTIYEETICEIVKYSIELNYIIFSFESTFDYLSIANDYIKDYDNVYIYDYYSDTCIRTNIVNRSGLYLYVQLLDDESSYGLPVYDSDFNLIGIVSKNILSRPLYLCFISIQKILDKEEFLCDSSKTFPLPFTTSYYTGRNIVYNPGYKMSDNELGGIFINYINATLLDSKYLYWQIVSIDNVIVYDHNSYFSALFKVLDLDGYNVVLKGYAGDELLIDSIYINNLI